MAVMLISLVSRSLCVSLSMRFVYVFAMDPTCCDCRVNDDARKCGQVLGLAIRNNFNFAVAESYYDSSCHCSIPAEFVEIHYSDISSETLSTPLTARQCLAQGGDRAECHEHITL